MLLSKLLNGANYTSDNFKDVDIANIQTNSKLVGKGSVFITFDGKTHKGIEFIDDVISQGAVAVVVEKKYNYKNDKIIVLSVDNTKETAGIMLHNFYNNQLPQHILAITGTKGKTSTVDFIRQMITKLGKTCVSIGTLGLVCEDKNKCEKDGSLTNPELVDLYRMLNKSKVEIGADYCAIEASSQGLDSGRLAGIYPDVIGFSNFDIEHLIYHKTMENYFECKMQLFGKEHTTANTKVVLNADIDKYKEILEVCKKNNIKQENILTFGYSGDVKLLDITVNDNYEQLVSIEFKGQKYSFNTKLIGEFQVINLIMALCYVYQLNIEKDFGKLVKILEEMKQVNGRANVVANLKNGAMVMVDYAHTDNSLRCILNTVKEHIKKIGKGRAILLMGFGGERDKEKRPRMSKIAQDMADFFYLTNDNYRSEDPKQIRADAEAGLDKNKKNYINFDGSREEAIEYAISKLQPYDILILAGKGHEKYSMENGKTIYFCEEEIVKRYVEKNGL